MADNEIIELSLITPQRMRFTGEVKEFTAPALKGEVNVLPEHTLYIAKLEPGTVSFVKLDGATEYFAVADGYLEVENNKAIILVEQALRVDEIKAADIEAQIDEIQKMLDEAAFGTDEYEELEVKLSRLRAAQNLAKPIA